MDNRYHKKKFRKTVRCTLFVILVLFASWITISNVITEFEKRTHLPSGQIVVVNDNKMHVYSKGEGSETILLMSGLGTASPVLDFQPLIDKLSKKYKVVVVENFGYGWSDTTNRERSVENIVEETRQALNKAEIKGPYILMPHSISGIYSIYYANTYPEEVKAVIGIDCTLPKQCTYFGEAYPKMSKLMYGLAPIGVSRLAVLVKPDSFLPVTASGTYSDKNLKLTKMMAIWNLCNRNVVSEINEIEDNVNKTIKMSFPEKLPVMVFTRESSKKREDGKTSESFYKTYLSGSNSNNVIVLEGHHYLHWTCSDKMVGYVEDFIGKIK